ncbi:MAG: signal recognition particle-docking protein FtsY [Candidatus Woesearchaeota archaeon]|nr:signal recognition particle-docking protein FtsY [Candidatus Woesearchaeota archaeon]
MFGFLKDKLKEAIGKFTKKAEDEAVEEPKQEVKEEKIIPPKKHEHKKEEHTEKKHKEEKKEAEKDKKKEDKKEKPKTQKQSDGHHKESHGEAAKVIEESKDELVHDEKSSEEVTEESIEETIDETIEEKQPEPKHVPAKKQDEPILESVDSDDLQEQKVSDDFTLSKPEEPKKESKGFFGLFKKKEKSSDIKEKVDKEREEAYPRTGEEKAAIQKKEEYVPVKEEPKGFFSKIAEGVTKASLTEKKFDEIFWELELSLLENNVAVEVIEKIKSDLKKDLVESKFNKKELDKVIMSSLRNSIRGLFAERFDLMEKVREKKPYVIVFIGINGTGKTTTLAKLAYLFKKNGLKPVIGACDTFRAAAIQQLEEHANNLNIKIIKHDYGSDPAAVAFDTIEHAKANGRDVVLIDTAGRLHSNKNLMAELEKVIRIAKPDLKIFIGESIAGNDVVEQVKLFNEKSGIDGVILSKADTDEKGGAAISVSYITGKPILYLGTGQTYDDLQEFDVEKLLNQIGL